jgi:hypothetical protein
LAGLINILAWTTWCRASEIFNVRFEDVSFIHPDDAAAHALPAGTGAFTIRLATQTKPSPTEQATVVVAATTATGLSMQFWWLRVLVTAPNTSATAYIFMRSDGTQFTSQYYRTAYLYPMLNMQRLQGEPTLQAYCDDNKDTAFSSAYRSMHSYRRGGGGVLMSLNAATMHDVQLPHWKQQNMADGALPKTVWTCPHIIWIFHYRTSWLSLSSACNSILNVQTFSCHSQYSWSLPPVSHCRFL